MPAQKRPRTRLAKFMAANDIPICALADICGRTWGFLLRSGKAQMPTETAAAIAALFSKRLSRTVTIEEISEPREEMDPARALRRLRSRRRQRVQEATNATVAG